MNTDLLNTFMAAAASRSFSQAAEGLYITPSAVVQQIKSLEALLGFTLFERSPAGIALTAAGRRYRDGVARLSDEYGALLEECLRADRAAPPLKVGISPNTNQPFLMSVCDSFRRACGQGVQTIPIAGTLNKAKALERGQVDVCVLTNFDRIDPDVALLVPLFETPSLVIAHASHPVLKLPACTLEDLAGFDVGVWESTSFYPFLQDQAAASAGVKIKEVLQDVGGAQAFCMNGGVLVAGKPIADSFGDSFGCTPLSCEVHTYYCVAYRHDAGEKAREFVELAARQAAARTADGSL